MPSAQIQGVSIGRSTIYRQIAHWKSVRESIVAEGEWLACFPTLWSFHDDPICNPLAASFTRPPIILSLLCAVVCCTFHIYCYRDELPDRALCPYCLKPLCCIVAMVNIVVIISHVFTKREPLELHKCLNPLFSLDSTVLL